MSELELLTTAQVLEFLQIGRTKLWELVRDGAFPAFRIGDGKNGPLRYRRTDVLHWLEAQRVDPMGESGTAVDAREP
jgi:predicted DNA-binding transcriptional regulator AlpA